MVDSYKLFWSNYFNFSGRTSRKDFWLTFLFYIILAVVLELVIQFIGGDNTEEMVTKAGELFSLIHSIGFLSIEIRRLHDIGKSGWWLFVSFIPVIGGIWLLILFLEPSK